MASTKCPACGLQNFSTAIVCRHCNGPLMGEAAREVRARVAPVRRESFRWFINGMLWATAYAFLLPLVIFLCNVIPNAMHSGETGWTDFTDEQMDTMLKWYLTLLGGGLMIILTIFFLRRRRYEL